MSQYEYNQQGCQRGVRGKKTPFQSDIFQATVVVMARAVEVREAGGGMHPVVMQVDSTSFCLSFVLRLTKLFLTLFFQVEAHYKGSPSMIPSRLQLVLLSSSSSSSPSSRSPRHLLPSCTPKAPTPGARYLLLLGTNGLMGNSKLFLTAPPRMVRSGTLARVKKLTCPSCGESMHDIPFSFCSLSFFLFFGLSLEKKVVGHSF